VFDQVRRILESSGDKSALESSITDLLYRSPQYQAVDQKWASAGGGGTQVVPGIVAAGAVAACVEYGPDEAVQRLKEFLSGVRPGRVVMMVEGVILDGRHRLGDGIDLIPATELDSPTYSFLAENARQLGAVFLGQGMLGVGVPTAIAVEASLAPSFSDEFRPHPTWETATADAEDVVLLLALLWPATPVEGMTWWEPKHKFLPTELKLAVTGHMQELSPLIGRTELSHDRLDSFSGIWTAWRSLPDRLRATLRVVLDRLARAGRKRLSVDAAIELGVAMEALLLDGGDGELKYRLSTRAGWLLGGADPKAREGIARLFRFLYDLRSTAVHTGRLPEFLDTKSKAPAEFKGKRTRDVLNRGCQECCRAAQTVIEKGALDFDRLVFGFGENAKT
jgi:hypothetical protein